MGPGCLIAGTDIDNSDVLLRTVSGPSEIAIISDIHGNAFALRLVLDDIKRQGINQAICLGDAIQGGPQPKECVTMLREFGCPIVMGNADSFVLDGRETGSEALTEQHVQVRAWQLAQLDASDIEFMENFAPTVSAAGGKFNILGFHGSPTDFDHILLPKTTDDELRAALGELQPNTFYCGGHTHVQQIRRIDNSFYLNPGSVGFAYSHHQPPDDFRADPWAEYAVLHIDDCNFDLRFHRITYDAAKMRQIYLGGDRPNKEAAAKQYEPR